MNLFIYKYSAQNCTNLSKLRIFSYFMRKIFEETVKWCWSLLNFPPYDCIFHILSYCFEGENFCALSCLKPIKGERFFFCWVCTHFAHSEQCNWSCAHPGFLLLLLFSLIWPLWCTFSFLLFYSSLVCCLTWSSALNGGPVNAVVSWSVVEGRW